MLRGLAHLRIFKPVVAAPALVAIMALTAPAPLAAQEEVSETRLRKIEAEIRALQRNVFPGGDGRYFEPQISSSDTPAAATRASGPSTSAVTDILARLDAIELQLQRLTSRTEENANAIALLSDRVASVEAGSAPALAANATEDIPAEETEEETEEDTEDDSATTSNLAAMREAPEVVTQESTPEPAGPSDERLTAVQEITKPQSDDPADDEYSYGYRLWNAGFYPEARQQLSSFIEAYPDHWRVTYGRNLLGRAYLDDGMAKEAAPWFLKNYQADRTAARAPDSLLFLAESMIALEDTRRACIALTEFGVTYPAVAAGRLLSRYQENRAKVTCEA
ncbi:MAG: hypothetical protein AAFR64_07505 [Pseudomonadota bacterium]